MPCRPPLGGRYARAICAVFSLLLGACAAPSAPYQSPDHWSKEGYEWPPGSAEREAQTKADERPRVSYTRAKWAEPTKMAEPAPVLSASPYRAAPTPVHAPLHESRDCLKELRKQGVSFKSLQSLKGVENPVEIHDQLGGVTFWASDRRPLQLDCRLALALEQLEPVFRQHGVTRVRFSGAYSYRRTRSGRLSHHAHGLAIDLHELHIGASSFSVDNDFARGVGCQPGVPPLNQVACALREQRIFEELLTPDFDFDHRDHLHISVPRRPGA